MKIRGAFRKPRRGNLIAILLFAVMIAIMSMGTLSVAMTLYSSGRQTAKQYADVQSYRAAIEIACYQYVNELEATTVTKNLSTDWLSVTGPAVYTQAVEVIESAIGKTDNPRVWDKDTIEEAITGALISDPSVMVNLLALLQEGRNSFVFTTSGLDIDWAAGESYVSNSESMLKIQPIEVTVDLLAKGEILKEVLYIDGLYLNVSSVSIGSGSNRQTLVTMNISEGESGVQIYRE